MSDPGNPAESVDALWREVVSALRGDTPGVDPLTLVGRGFTGLLPADGVSISVFGTKQRSETLYSSGEMSTRVAALQSGLGEGPSWEASDTHAPVLVPDLSATEADSWPVFAVEIAALQVKAIYAFPLHSGVISIGVVSLHRGAPGWLTPEQVTTALRIVDIAMLALLERQTGSTADERSVPLPDDRDQVHQATGMLIAAHDISAEQALLRLRAYSFASGRMVDDVARDLVSRRLAPSALED